MLCIHRLHNVRTYLESKEKQDNLQRERAPVDEIAIEEKWILLRRVAWQIKKRGSTLAGAERNILPGHEDRNHGFGKNRLTDAAHQTSRKCSANRKIGHVCRRKR